MTTFDTILTGRIVTIIPFHAGSLYSYKGYLVLCRQGDNIGDIFQLVPAAWELAPAS